MSAALAKLIAAEGAGATLCLDGGQVKVRYSEDCRQALAPLLAQLRQHREEVIRLLREREAEQGIWSALSRPHGQDEVVQASAITWPAASAGAERRFGHPAARLYPFIGQTVRTPAGPGTLLQVFSDRTTVFLDSEQTKPKDLQRVMFFDPADIYPPAVM